MKKYFNKYLQTLRDCPNKKAVCLLNMLIAFMCGVVFCGCLPVALNGNWFAIIMCPLLFVWTVDGLVSSFILRKYLKKEKTHEIQEKNQ